MGFLNRILGHPDADGGASRSRDDSEIVDGIRHGLEQHQAGDLKAAESAYRETLDLAPDHADAHYLLGSLLGESGCLDEALTHLEQAARLDPSAGAARSDIGNVYRTQGRFEEAEAAYRDAIAIDADTSNAHQNLGDLLHFQGRVDEAIDCFSTAASLTADDADLHFVLADMLSARGRYQEASRSYRTGLNISPRVAAAHNNLGASLRHLSQDQEALACFEDALRLDPKLGDAHANLADLLQARGLVDKAVEHYRTAAELQGDSVRCWRSLGQLLLAENRADEALQSYREVMTLEPDSARSHFELGNALIECGAVDEAIERFRQSVRLDPEDSSGHVNLGFALSEVKRFEEAARCFRDALAVDTDLVEAHNNLGGVLQLQGRLDLAMKAYERALSLADNDLTVRSNLLTCLNYHADAQPEEVFAHHLRWSECFDEVTAASAPARIHRTDPNRRLRIGYVSADFRFHSVSFFMSALLEQHDRDGFEIFCYANVRKPDSNTERLMALADHWREVALLDDDEMTALVCRDSIDILVDLSGHTVGNRLPVFARRAAPIQVTYLGYPNTTGLSVMDYRLTDASTDPEGRSEHLHSEELMRLPHGFLCYEPLPSSPDIRERSEGGESSTITFASFNELLKITAPIIAAWCEILERTPNSRLLLKGTTLADEGTRDRVVKRFVQHGIDEERIELIGSTPSLEAHLDLYNRADIALDTFPYNGTTTTCEALWMGIPVVSLSGQVHAARVGVSILSAVGLDDLVVDNMQAYVDSAVALAVDGGRRQQLKRSLRRRMRDSTLMDAPLITRDLEAAFREMWKRACDRPVAGEIRDHDELETRSCEGETLRVNIGGQAAKPGWKILNILPADYVDYLRDCTDLSCFEGESVDEFYASHVLEHLGYTDELPRTLRELNRALKPGGVLRISVPDLEVLCRLFLDGQHSAEVRFEIMRIIYGGQIDEYDFHKVGLTWEILVPMLEAAGFGDSRRVREFEIFDDFSSARIDGQLISLNVEAVKA